MHKKEENKEENKYLELEKKSFPHHAAPKLVFNFGRRPISFWIFEMINLATLVCFKWLGLAYFSTFVESYEAISLLQSRLSFNSFGLFASHSFFSSFKDFNTR